MSPRVPNRVPSADAPADGRPDRRMGPDAHGHRRPPATATGLPRPGSTMTVDEPLPLPPGHRPAFLRRTRAHRTRAAAGRTRRRSGRTAWSSSSPARWSWRRPAAPGTPAAAGTSSGWPGCPCVACPTTATSRSSSRRSAAADPALARWFRNRAGGVPNDRQPHQGREHRLAARPRRRGRGRPARRGERAGVPGRRATARSAPTRTSCSSTTRRCRASRSAATAPNSTSAAVPADVDKIVVAAVQDDDDPAPLSARPLAVTVQPDGCTSRSRG